MYHLVRSARWVLLSAAALGASPLGGAPRLKEPPEETLYGTWKQTFSGFNGEDATERERPFLNHWVITRDRITIFTKGNESGHWTYRLDAARRPAQMDLTADAGGMPTTYPCIYTLHGDELTVCLQNFPARGRPTGFDPKPESGICKFVYVRVKPGDEKLGPPGGK